MAKIGIKMSLGKFAKAGNDRGYLSRATNSLVAIIHPDSKKPITLRKYDSPSLVPSIIHFSEGGAVLVGEEA
ncbi:MAG: hypothetical protein WKF89_09050 [Chitinophagaceae bacterium]